METRGTDRFIVLSEIYKENINLFTITSAYFIEGIGCIVKVTTKRLTTDFKFFESLFYRWFNWYGNSIMCYWCYDS